MCRGQVSKKDEEHGAWKGDYGPNLYLPDHRSDTTTDAGPLFVDLNERVAVEMKKDIFVYFRHYTIERGTTVRRRLKHLNADNDETQRTHWWAKMKHKFSDKRTKL